jgi:hypothetical protein
MLGEASELPSPGRLQIETAGTRMPANSTTTAVGRPPTPRRVARGRRAAGARFLGQGRDSGPEGTISGVGWWQGF